MRVNVRGRVTRRHRLDNVFTIKVECAFEMGLYIMEEIRTTKPRLDPGILPKTSYTDEIRLEMRRINTIVEGDGAKAAVLIKKLDVNISNKSCSNALTVSSRHNNGSGRRV